AFDQSAGAFEVLWRVDAERDGIDDFGVDAHAGFERAKLLQALALLKHGLAKRDESLQRGAAPRVDADVMVERALTPRGGGAGKIERSQARGAYRGADDLHHARRGLFFLIDDL